MPIAMLFGRQYKVWHQYIWYIFVYMCMCEGLQKQEYGDRQAKQC